MLKTVAPRQDRRILPRTLRLLLAVLLSLCAVTPALAQADLAVDLSGPTSYSPGLQVDAAWTLDVDNIGDAAASAGITTTFPAAVSVAWQCSATGTATCPAATGTGTLALTGVNLPATSGLRFVFDATYGAALDGALTVSAQSSHGSTPTIDSDTTVTPLRVLFTGPATYTPGVAVQDAWQLVVENDGAGSSVAAIETDFPPGVQVSWSCTQSPSGVCVPASAAGAEVNVSEIIPAGAVVTYLLDTGYASSLSLDPLVARARAYIGTAATGPYVSASSDIDRRVDVSIDKTNAGVSTYTPGSPSNWRVTVSNAGPSDLAGLRIVDTAPGGMTIASWTCSATGGSCANASGSGNIDQLVSITDDGQVVFEIVGSHATTATQATITNTASYTIPTGYTDSAGSTGSDSASKTRQPRTDLSAAAPTPPTAYVPGTVDQALRFVIANAGPSASIAAVAGGTLPARVDIALPQADVDPGSAVDLQPVVQGVAWSCVPTTACPVASSGVANDSFSVPVSLAAGALVEGGSVEIRLLVDYPSGLLETPLVFSAQTQTTETDPDGNDNLASITLAVDRRADLEIEKTASAVVVNPGGAFYYDLVVTNHGPSDSPILLSDDLPAALERAPMCTQVDPSSTAPCWEYCGQAGVAFEACGDLVQQSGDLAAEPFDLVAGDTLQVRVHASAADTANGTVSNTALVARGAGVAQPAGTDSTANFSTADVEIDVSSNIAVTKTDGASTAVPGATHSYTVTVVNQGFIAVDNVLVTDQLPLYAAAGDAGFVPGSISWTCSAANGACCNTNSNTCGSPQPTPPIVANGLSGHGVDLPAGSSVTFQFTGTLDGRASGNLRNIASIVVPAEVNDPVPADDTATDDTTLAAVAGLGVDKRLVDLTEIAGDGFALRYEIEITNAGPSRGEGVAVEDLLEAGKLDVASATWSCTVLHNPGATACDNATGTGNILSTIDLDVGGRVLFTLEVDTPTPAVAGLITNTASASLGTDSASDTVVSGLTGSAELSISKSDGLDDARPGEEIEYVIRVQNAGPDDVFAAEVEDNFVRELEDATWSCTATTPIPGDLEVLGDSSGVPFTGISSGRALAISPDGAHVYQLAGSASTLMVFQRDSVPGATFGTLVERESESEGQNDGSDPGPVVEGLAGAVDVAVTAGGSRVYVLSPGAIAVFDRDTNPASSNFGRLSFASAATAGVAADVREMVLLGQQLVVVGGGGITVFPLDEVSGLPGTGVFHGAEPAWNPLHIAALPASGQVLVASSGTPHLRRFIIDANGAASLAGSLANSNYAGVTELAAGPEGQHAYLSSQATGTLSVIGLGDTLTHATHYTGAMLVSAFAPPLAASPLARVHSFAIAPDGEHLLMTAQTGAAPDSLLLRFGRDVQTGLLTAQSAHTRNVTGATTGDPMDELLVTPDGRHVLLASGSALGRPLQAWSRRAPDPLFAQIEVDREGDAIPADNPSPGAPRIAGLLAPADVVVSRDGQYLYAVSIADDSLTVFRREPNQGFTADTAGNHLAFVARYRQGEAGVLGLDAPQRLRISPDGTRVYVTSEVGNSLAVFSRNTVNGTLAFIEVLVDGAASPSLGGASGLVVDGLNQRVYVAGRFDDAIGIFAVDAGGLTWQGEVKGGIGGVTGMDGIRDLAITADGSQLLGVSGENNAIVVFRRNTAAGPAYGTLSFVHSRLAGAQNPVAIALPQDAAGTDPHVYLVAENSDELVVMRRITDPASADFGRVVPLFEYANGNGGISLMDAPRDIEVSPDGRRVYVAARDASSVLIFDRDLNQSSATYGGVTIVEQRRDGVDGVEGLDTVYALAVSPDSRHVYAAGFDDQAIASFAIGNGSSCSAGGSGALDDLVNIGKSGTLEYRIRARIRPDATGQVCNIATVTPPERFVDSDLSDNRAEDCTNLTPQGDLSVSKTNDQVSVVAGQPVSYEVVVRNPGPSHLVHTPGTPVTLTDALPASAGFLPDTATWTCEASASGALEFVAATFDGEPGAEALAGISGLALVPDSDGAGPLGNYVAAASVLDHGLTLFRRDPLDGSLLAEARLVQGAGASSLAGARAVVASADGRFLYVASRTSDSVTVLRIDEAGAAAALATVQVQQGVPGLDQATHLLLSPDGAQLYVAGANDSAVAVFARDATDGTLTWLESEVQGIDDLADAGGTVLGLANVQFLVASPDGAQLYALSGTGAAISRFDRDPATGRLSWRGVLQGASLPPPASLSGAAGAAFDAAGDYLYVAATDANQLLAFERDSGSGALVLVEAKRQGIDGSLGLVGPRRVLLSGDGNHVYVSAQGGSSVAWYLRDPLSGTLSYLGQRSTGTVGVSGLAGATGMVLDDAVGQLYVAGTLDNALVQFERQADSFCPPSGSGPLLAVPFDIAAGGTVTFRIEVDVDSTLAGALVNTVSVDAGSADPNPDNDSATDTDVYTAVADLSIHKSDGLAEFDGLAGATALAGDEANLYVAGATDNAIGIFERLADGSAVGGERVEFLDVLRGSDGGAQGLAGASDLLLSPDGLHLYVASPVENSVAAYARELDGRLQYLGVSQNGVLGVTGLSGARALAISPDGRHVYAVGSFSSAIAVFARNADPGSPQFGRLAFLQTLQNGVGTVQGLGAPVALAVSADGKHVYALGSEADSIAVFLRNGNAGSSGFGQLSWLSQVADGGAVTGLAGARSLAIHPGGGHLYVLGTQLGSIAHFTRDASSGQLAFVADVRDGEAGVTGLAGASRLRLGAAGDALFVAAADADALLQFALDAGGVPSVAAGIANGDSAPETGGQVLGLDGASDLLVDPDGSHVFSVSGADAALARFGRDAGNGTLSFRQVLFDGLGGVAPGDAVRYVIRVENHGPSDVSQARVVDVFPAAFESVSWSCTSENGAQCATSGQGNIDRIVDLPVGGAVTFEADGIVGDSASGTLVNTATVQAQPVSGVAAVDPDESNNSSTDDDTVLSPASNLVVQVDDGSSTATPGGPVAYEVVVSNLGPSYAEGVRLIDQMPAALLDVAWTCEASPVAGVLGLPSEFAAPLQAYRALRIATLGRHAYAVGNDGGIGAVALYRRDPLSGALAVQDTYVDGVEASGIAGASDLVLSNDQRFAFVAGADADAIAVFSRDAEDGTLEWQRQYQDGDLGIDGLGGVTALALSPDGAFLYAASMQDDAISAFAVDQSDGSLVPVGTLSQVQPGMDGLNGVRALAFSADGGHLFAIAGDNQALSAYARAGNGSLAPVALLQNFELPEDALLAPTALLVSGERILVASGNGRVSQFAFDAAAVLSLQWSIADGDPGVSGLVAPMGLAFDPEQARLYVAADGALHLFSLLEATPAPLASYDAATYPSLAGLVALALSPDRRMLYSTGSATGISVFGRERGSRCGLSGARALLGQSVDIAPGGEVRFLLQGQVFANASGTLTYAVSAEPRTDGEEIDPSDNSASDIDLLVPAPDLAALKSDSRDTVVAGTPISWRIDIANAGVSDALGALLSDPAPIWPDAAAGLAAGSGAFECTANAPLLAGAVTAAPALAGVSRLAALPDGSRLFALVPGADTLLSMPRATDGSLGAAVAYIQGQSVGGETVDGLDTVSGAATTPDGRHLLVTASGSNALTVFAIQPGGELLPVQQLRSGEDGVSGLLGAADVVVSADGRRVFVASAASHAITVFSRDPDNGALAFVERVADGFGTVLPDSNVLRGASRLHLSDDGSHLFALATLSRAITSFSVHPESARLTYLGRVRVDDAGGAGLAGARDLAGSGSSLYALGAGAVTLLVPEPGGRAVTTAVYDALPGLSGDAVAISLDEQGSRLYVTDQGGGVHVFARDWSDGTLDWRTRYVDALAPVGSVALLSAAGTDLFLAQPQPGRIERLNEHALSRCLAASGTADAPAVPVDLGLGGGAEITFTGTVHPSARGVLSNSATVAPVDGADPAPQDNIGTDTTLVTVVSDLSLAKSGPAAAVAGEVIEYRISVINAGPSSALGMRVLDALAPELLQASWTCNASTGSTCEAAGTGLADVEADLLPGGSLEVVLNARIAPGFVGTLSNAASLVMEPGASDPSTGDHTDQVDTAIHAEATLSVEKDNGVDAVTAGDTTVWVIRVANAGPSDAASVQVDDALAAVLSQASWTCTASGSGSACPAAGIGDLAQTVSVGAGGDVAFTLQALIDADAEGVLANTATATVLDATIERSPGDETATDSDPIVASTGLSLALSVAADPFDPASQQALPLFATVANAGPSLARLVELEIGFSAAATMTLPASCSVLAPDRLRCTIANLPAGTATTLQFGLRGLPAAPGTFTANGTVQVRAQDLDPDAGDNADSVQVTLATGTDVVVSIDNDAEQLVPGRDVLYLVEVANYGSVAIADVGISVPLAAGLLSASWTCTGSGTTCTGSGTGSIVDTLDLASGQSVRYRLQATVDPAIDTTTPTVIAQWAMADTSSGSDMNPANNSAVDEDVVLDVIFRDGFEAPPPAGAKRGEDRLQAHECRITYTPAHACPAIDDRDDGQ